MDGPLSRNGDRLSDVSPTARRTPPSTNAARRVRLSVQPAFDAAWGGADGMYATRLGAGRAAALNPFADLATAGVPLAFRVGLAGHRRRPVGPASARRVQHHAVDQRISARAAFRASTRGGWRVAGLDHTGAGELRVGSPAHLAVWRAEHLTVQAAEGRFSSWRAGGRLHRQVLRAPDRQVRR